MSGGDHTCPNAIPLPSAGVTVYDHGRETSHDSAIGGRHQRDRGYHAGMAGGCSCSAHRVVKTADAVRSSGAIKVAGGPTAAEVIARFGQQGPKPSDETVRLWIREHKEAQGGE